MAYEWVQRLLYLKHTHTSPGSTKQPTDDWVKRLVNLKHTHTSAGSTKQPTTDDWVDRWIKRYTTILITKRIFPISQIHKESIDLKVSLQMLLQEATTFADRWTDVNYKFGDRRSFPTFLRQLQDLGLDWHKYNVPEDNDLDVSNQPNRWSSLQASSSDVVHLHPELTSDPNWVMANKYYGRSLSLMRLLQKIRTESPDGFSQEQAKMLEPFLGHLIMIQQEQRVVACSFSKHLEQLRNFDAASLLAFSSTAANDDGDRGTKQPTEYYMWQHKHLFDSLCIVSRGSTWLLKKLKDSRFASPSFKEESEILVEFLVDFISKFKKSKELLGHHLDNLIGVPEDEMTQMVRENKEILNHFGNHIKCLQQEGVGEGSVIEKLLGCLGDVCKISMDDYGEKDRLSSLDIEFEKAVQEALELIEETRKMLDSDRLSSLSGGSPLGNITLWRILFESSVAGLRLDLISKRHGEAIKLGVRLLEESRHATAVCLLVDKYLNELHAKISLLLSDGNRVLLDFVAMHRTVAEITYMLGDAFTTGGAGMKDLRDETWAPGSSSRVRDEEMEMDIILNFPWDKHNVPPTEEFDPTKKFELLGNPRLQLLCDPAGVSHYNDDLILRPPFQFS